MATIVRVRGTESHFILLGTGFGIMKSARPHRFLGDALPVENSREAPMVALCDAEGGIHWSPSRDLEVISIDGKSPVGHLKGFLSDSGILAHCPSTVEGVKEHACYGDFLEANENHRYVYAEDLVNVFQKWLISKRVS